MVPYFAPENERFSLDDPEAGRKLAENLDARKVRLAFSELCTHFGCRTYDEKETLRAFMRGLHESREVIEVLPNLFCRPDMTQGNRSGTKAIKEAAKEIGRMKAASAKKAAAPTRAPKPRGKKDTALRDRQADRLLEFAMAKGPDIKALSFAAEGERLGMDRARVTYILTHLRARGLLTSNGYGTYQVRPSSAPKTT